MLETAATSLDLQAMGQAARAAAATLAKKTTAEKNAVLMAIADAIEARTDDILAANQRDLDMAAKNGIDPIWIRDRIALRKRMPGIIADVRKVADLPDPVGEIMLDSTLENGLRLIKRRTPLGVLGAIYESRPNVTVDISTLALKTGNAVILRGGSDVLHSNLKLTEVLQDRLAQHNFPTDAIQTIGSADRRYVSDMLRLHEYIDMIIPRGGNGLHTFCRENSSIPVITGGIGICHIFVDASADLDKALPLLNNAKTQRPAVCNSMETLLAHEAVADKLLPRVVDDLGAAGVEFHAGPRALDIVGCEPRVLPALDGDFDTEWYNLTLNLKVVADVDAAIAHIARHGTQHSDSILTETPAHAEKFLNEVDSAAVYWNASTRFTDGSAMGLGAEVAISTQKLHARGPMALEELTTYKWVVKGDYTIRAG
ncbi:MAG: glutamate-5-semialdehyde dehydrogenase [Chloroflexi bacterium]|nr:glutamate-5-semialdehyde dehydrogenase [Chloroflexota bacterium]MCY4246069.1 glutamate-5-semialdehyde dehydrogenase [Chloroflexota bacterium]